MPDAAGVTTAAPILEQGNSAPVAEVPKGAPPGAVRQREGVRIHVPLKVVAVYRRVRQQAAAVTALLWPSAVPLLTAGTPSLSLVQTLVLSRLLLAIYWVLCAGRGQRCLFIRVPVSGSKTICMVSWVCRCLFRLSVLHLRRGHVGDCALWIQFHLQGHSRKLKSYLLSSHS